MSYLFWQVIILDSLFERTKCFSFYFLASSAPFSSLYSYFWGHLFGLGFFENFDNKDVINLIATLRLALSFLPAPLQAIILGLIGLLLLILIFRIIRMVLDAIPFL